jgi:hypothetical protein
MDSTLTLRQVNNNTEATLLPVQENTPSATESAITDASTEKPFMQANTIDITIDEIRRDHIIPVYIKDNEPLISQIDFIDATSSIVADVFAGERILRPSIRLSHPVKGRIPDARDKPANQLEDWEKTIYYERMAFIIEVPTISDVVGGNQLSLTIGGIKAYNFDTLTNKKGSDEHFKIFIGFENKVCTNLCIWTDGTMLDLKVKSLGQLKACIRSLIEGYNKQHHLFHLKELCNHALTEQQFATLVGRCRMFNHLPQNLKKEVPELSFGDTQLSAVCKDYYRDDSFCKDTDGNINLWRLYNLFTNANKSTYIDSFADRSTSAFSFVYNLKQALQHQTYNWYLS